MKTIKVAIISSSASNWPIYIGQKLGIFTKKELNVEVIITGSSKKQLFDMETGGVYDIGFVAADHIIRAANRGGTNLFMFMGIASPFYNLMTRPEITNHQQLKNKKLGVDGKGSGYALLLKKLLQANGVKEDQYGFIEIGGSQKRLNALLEGEISGTFLDAPSDIIAEKKGFNCLGSNLDCITNYQGRIAATRRDWAVNNCDLLVTFIKAYIEAIDWFYNTANKSQAVDILLEELKLEKEIAESAYDRYIKYKVFNIKGLLNIEGIKQVVNTMMELNQINLEFELAEVYDLKYYNKAK